MATGWGEAQQQAFDRAKAILTSLPLLAQPDYDKGAGAFVLQTDASNVGVGAVLMQMQNSKLRPICYISRSLIPAERNYDSQHKEALAVVWAVRKLRHYLHGYKFQIQTDHHNLKRLFSNRHDGQMFRWAAALSEFDYSIKYKKDVRVADLLSRDPRWLYANNAVTHMTDLEDLVAAVHTTAAHTGTPPSGPAAAWAMMLRCAGPVDMRALDMPPARRKERYTRLSEAASVIQAWTRRCLRSRPCKENATRTLPRLLDLFCGGGGSAWEQHPQDAAHIMCLQR